MVWSVTNIMHDKSREHFETEEFLGSICIFFLDFDGGIVRLMILRLRNPLPLDFGGGGRSMDSISDASELTTLTDWFGTRQILTSLK